MTGDKLLREARDRPCQIRVPGFCLGTYETTVACHVRMIGLSGFGMKSDPIFCAWGCFNCHQVVDGQRKSEFSAAERRQMLIEGMIRTQAILVNEGKIRW